jgi:hypothetical protein
MNGDKAQVHRWVQRFLFSAVLYAPNEISFGEATALFVDHFAIEGYCPHCKNISVFNRRRGTRGTTSIEALLNAQEFCLFELVCKRDVRHSIVCLLYLNNGRIQKVGQFPSPGELGNAAPWKRSLQQNMIFSLRFVKQRVQQIGESSDSIRSSVRPRLSSFAENIRAMWVARQSLGSLGTAVALIAAVSALTLYEGAKRETELKQQIEAIQRGDHSDTAQTVASSKLQADDKSDAFGKALEAVRHSQNDSLVAILNAHLDQPPAAAPQPDQKFDTPVPLRKEPVDPAPVASTHVDRQSASTPSDAFTEVDRQSGDQPSDAFTQVDQQQANQQWEDSARIDQQPPSQLADASGQAKKKAEKPIQQSDASAPEGADQAKPRAPHDESKPTNANAPAVPHLGIGVGNLTPGIAEAMGLAKKRGIIIMAVDPGSPAEKAGVRTRDLLLKIGGTPVSRPDQVREALLSFKGKHTLVLTLKRDGKIEHLKLNVG